MSTQRVLGVGREDPIVPGSVPRKCVSLRPLGLTRRHALNPSERREGGVTVAMTVSNIRASRSVPSIGGPRMRLPC